jgi:hypothetical protein
MCAVSAPYQFPRKAGEEESKTSFRISAYLARKLKEDKSMPGKRKKTEGVYVRVPQVLNVW